MNEDRDKKNYELAFLVEDEGGYADILRLCRQHNLEIKSEGQPKKIDLAYTIGKLAQAHFGFSQFSGLPEDVKGLEGDLKTNSRVRRSMIVRLPKGAAASRRVAAPVERRGGGFAPKRRPSAVPAQRPPAASLSNEEIEKKIEEILQ